MDFYILGILLIIVFISWVLKRIANSPEARGRQGESNVAHSLERLAFRGINGRILRNVHIPTSENHSVEIDLLYITVKGIIVVESKNYAGYIFGNERNKNWTLTLYGGKNLLGFKKVDKFHFYNPVWQNHTHIKCLKKYLEKDIECLSVIVFSDRGDLNDVTWHSDDTVICQNTDVNSKIKKYWKSTPDCMSEEEVDRTYALLYPLTFVSDEDRERHISQVNNKKYGKKVQKPESELQDTPKCPWCGGDLVIRTAKHGPSAGSQFYGCSNFPECRYTRNIT